MCECDSKTKEQELWRLRLNWAFIIFMAPMYSISMYGIISSFHQFVTNPTEVEILSQNNTKQKIEPGLGESELFYSLLISATNVGAIIGGLVCGFLVGIVPYWYLWAVSLVAHTISYVMYCVVHQGWLMMISRLLAGYFAGATLTLGFSYFTDTSVLYVEKLTGAKTESERVRNYLFATFSFSMNLGFLLGPGFAVIVAQFESVDQFRAIGWFNVAYGVVVLCVLVILFRGEMSFKTDRRLSYCQAKKQNSSCRLQNMSLLSLFIIISFLFLFILERIRAAFIGTVFNPIASDSFGIDESGASYFVLVLSIPLLGGSISLLVFQRLKMSSQMIVLTGIITTMCGYLIVTDWQTIPYDPCTEYSPFHHPEIVQYYENNTIIVGRFQAESHLDFTLPKLKGVKLLSNINLIFADGTFFESDLRINLSCSHVDNCTCALKNPACLHFKIDENLNILLATSPEDVYYYDCSFNFNLRSPITACITLSRHQTALVGNRATAPVSKQEAEIESINVLPKRVYFVARNSCIEANVTGHQCHWIPSSTITKKECKDCQPICRSVSQTLTFTQFLVGNGLLVYTSALQYSPIVSLLMNQTPKQIQGIVIGSMTAVGGVSSSVSPLLIDAVYEEMKKRVFLLTILFALVHFPFILEIVALYPKLGPRTTDNTDIEYSKLEHE
ncbi:uncharacterized protein LOC135334489 [Halichondria panicea]|uniref:uncharacterized protein LOC135334489 n=1 Tax=Halichondria panicea TaxID=6063 RepID=UPI00312B32E2